MPPVNSEDDLDDLDEVLEQFNKTNVPAQSSSTSSNPHLTISSPPPAPPAEDEETKAFREALEKMLLESFQGLSTDEGSNSEEIKAAKEMRDSWEKMLIEDLEAGGKGNSLFTPGSPSRPANLKDRSTRKEKEKLNPEGEEDSFQKAIRQAMDKLQSSDDALKANPEGLSQEDDTLDNLLSSLRDLNIDGEDGEGLESTLESIMSQLMSKEILYEPLKELDTKYPGYLTEHGPSLSGEDLIRYTAQKAKVSAIVAIFEHPSHSDDDPIQAAEILKLMNEMQSYGSPPAEIMGEMPPGFELDSDGLPKLPGCLII